MSPSDDLRIEPTAASPGTAPMHAAHQDAAPAFVPAEERRPHAEPEHAVTTGGSLRAAYAEFVVDPDTHDVVVRIRDAATDRVLHEMPTPEVQHVMQYLTNYADTLARRRAARPSTGF